MAKKQTRRSISVSRTTYERLKAFCEANNISMSQLVETRVNDFLGDGPAAGRVGGSGETTFTPRPTPPAPPPSAYTSMSRSPAPLASRPSHEMSAPQRPSSPAIPMTSAAARYAVEPPPPIIKPKQETAAPKPAEKRADQIFTF